jgi:predicted kinase
VMGSGLLGHIVSEKKSTQIVFGGLPGTGKTTLARAVAEEHAATYLRIDTIEQVLRSSGVLVGDDVGPAGYLVAYKVAESNLLMGRMVVADSVNPLAVTRDAWRRVAASTSSEIVEVEVVCSDLAEHRRRVETRATDVPGLALPTWRDVVERDYEPWDRSRIVLDTAGCTIEDALKEFRTKMSNIQVGL